MLGDGVEVWFCKEWRLRGVESGICSLGSFAIEATDERGRRDSENKSVGEVKGEVMEYEPLFQ